MSSSDNGFSFLWFQSCEKSGDFRAAQCAAFNNVPYSGQLLKWYSHYDPARPCALICRGEQTLENGIRRSRQEVSSDEKTLPRDATDSLQFDSDETIVVQLADKVEDGTRCYAEGMDVCIGGECMVSQASFFTRRIKFIWEFFWNFLTIWPKVQDISIMWKLR